MSDFAMRRHFGPTPHYPLVKAYVPKREDFIVIAGPCSVESPEQIKTIAKMVARSGATHLRGGVFRAGTYPGKSFGWVPEELRRAHHEAARENGLLNIVEVLDYTDLDKILPYADCLQVGARQAQNYTLLRKLGATGKTIFLKRNPGMNIDEWLGSAEHLLHGGDCSPVLIERGGASHLNHTRWELSISIIPAVKAITRLPIIVDASHGTGRRDLVPALTLSGVAAGADGILVEVHPDPERSLSDADQAIHPTTFDELMRKTRVVRAAIKAEEY